MKEEKAIWVTKDGRVLVIDEITDINHLRNIIKHLLKKKQLEDEWERGDYGDLQDTF